MKKKYREKLDRAFLKLTHHHNFVNSGFLELSKEPCSSAFIELSYCISVDEHEIAILPDARLEKLLRTQFISAYKSIANMCKESIDELSNSISPSPSIPIEPL